ATSNVFPVEIESTEPIDCLKKLLKTEKTPGFDDIAAYKLSLWRVSIPDSEDETLISIGDVSEKKKKLRVTNKVSIFGAALPDDMIHILVLRPPLGNETRHSDYRPHDFLSANLTFGLSPEQL
ncbi:hypothetical protein BGW38_002417, partial [Lunasporangiospora selenospora]